MKKIIALLLCLLVLAGLASCASTPVNVSLNGGTMELMVEKNTALETVVSYTPQKEGYVFAGWYSDSGFSDYINPNAVTRLQKKAGTAFAKWIVVPTSKIYTVRRDQATITDSGRDKQQLDCVGLAADYNIQDLKRAGYMSLQIKLTALVSEKDDGYQYIFLYKNQQCNSSDIGSLDDFYDKYVFGEDETDPNLLYGKQFEHGGSVADSSWQLVTLETTISLDNMENDLYIRYGASGKNDDTWYNKEVTVEISPIGGPASNQDQPNDVNDPELAEFRALIKTTPEKEGYVFAGWYSDENLTDYIDPNYILPAQQEKKTAYPKWIEEPTEVRYTVRTDRATITDDGREEQKMDTVKVGDDLSLMDYRRAGYRYLVINVSMDIAEENDGYQYVFVYNTTKVGSNDNTDAGLLYKFQHDHGGSGVYEWSNVGFQTSIPLDKVTDNLYLRYGASGEKEDTWYNKNVQMIVTVVK